MTIMTGKRGLMESLKAERVKYIFGNPGTSELPIMEELERHPELDYILVMQEGVGLGMADTLARVTGEPSFVSLHIETGLANGISLLHNAHQGGTPMVISAANGDIRKLAQGRTDLVEMVRPFTKFSAEITHPEQVPSIMRRAFNEAKTPPTGPTFVGFSANALDGMADMNIEASGKGYFQTGPDIRAVQDTVNALAGSKNPILVVGDRVSQSKSVNEVVKLAEILGARVYASAFSEMNFPMTHPQFSGMVQPGSKDGRQKLSSGDVVLAIGKLSTYAQLSSNPELLLIDLNTTFIHVDNDPSEIGKSQPTDVGIVADPKVALTEITEALSTEMSGSAKEAAKGRIEILSQEKREERSKWGEVMCSKWNNNPMSDERMLSELASSVPENSVILADANTSRASMNKIFQFDTPGAFHNMRGGAIGWGLGGAMGLKLAHPDKPVISIVGDGSAMMTVQAFWTTATRNIPAIFVITNNGAYKVLQNGMDSYKKFIKSETESAYIGMDFPDNLDIAALARDMGVAGKKITDPSDIGPSVKTALDSGKPAVLDMILG